MKLNNYIRVERFKDELISGTVSGTVSKGALVELYDSLNNPLGIYSHIEEISLLGIHYDSISEGTLASFYIPSFQASFLDKGYKIVVIE
ncbi:MAG: hypothetical protein K6G28_04145 [Acholeplasmatales bacterium]|nr:hypothetical protein [Acholeplasmatales bacterium]